MSQSDFDQAIGDTVIFDRSALDAVIWFDQTKTPLSEDLRRAALGLNYDRQVFLVPPWPEIYRLDADRQHSFDEALAGFRAICERLPDYGFTPVLVPKRSVSERADWLEAELAKGETA